MMQKAYPAIVTVYCLPQSFENLKEMCLSADIIIVALGVPEFLKGDMVKERGCNRGCGYDTCAGCNSQKAALS